MKDREILSSFLEAFAEGKFIRGNQENALEALRFRSRSKGCASVNLLEALWDCLRCRLIWTSSHWYLYKAFRRKGSLDFAPN